MSTSDDEGASWSAPSPAGDRVAGVDRFNHWLSVDPVTGDVNVSYYDTRNDTTGSRYTTDVYLARSADGRGKVDGDYLLYVGLRIAHKNLDGAVKITASDVGNTATTAATEADAIGYNKGVYNKGSVAQNDATGHWTTGNAGKNYLENQWAYYQSKSIKGYLYELQRDKLDLELKAGARAAGEYRKKIEFYQNEIGRYKEEKEDIKRKAEELEAQRNNAQKHSGAFGLAAMFLQIAILLSSIAALMKQKYFWFLGMAGGCLGLLYFFNGFFLFM